MAPKAGVIGLGTEVMVEVEGRATIASVRCGICDASEASFVRLFAVAGGKEPLVPAVRSREESKGELKFAAG